VKTDPGLGIEIRLDVVDNIAEAGERQGQPDQSRDVARPIDEIAEQAEMDAKQHEGQAPLGPE
jgi:hypothetical protein